MSLRINRPHPIIVPANPTPLPGGAQNSQVLTNINGQNVWTYPQYWIQGKNFIPSRTVDVSSVQQFELSATGKYLGASLSNRGFIYCFPDNSNNVMIINPYTNQVDTTTISNITNARYPVLQSDAYKFAGGVTYNNNIYSVPQRAKAVMNINTLNNTVSFIDVSNFANVTDNWLGAVLSPNGIIYGINHQNTSVLRIDPSTNAVSTINISGLAGSANYYAGGVLAPNGNIYGVPFNATSVLVIDTSNNTARANIAGLTGLTGTEKWLGGVLGPNGRIYCIPFDSPNCLVIDTSSNTTSNIAVPAGNNQWYGGVLGLDGFIYGIPHRSSSVLRINPFNNTANVTDISGVNTINDRWAGGVLAPNGKIYMVMSNSPNVGIIKTDLPTQEPWMTAPEYNKI